MGDYQSGFRDGIINEKLWEYNQTVQHLFIDFQKAYDSIPRDTLTEMYERI